MNNYSHDLMNSLYTIKGMAEVHLEKLRDGFEGNPIPETLDVMERMKRKSEDALSIVRRLQERKGVRSGTSRPDPFPSQKVSLSRAFLETQRHFAASSSPCFLKGEDRGEGVEFLDRVPKDFPPILSNRKEFREILHHLIQNSLDAMKENQSPKRIILRAALIDSDPSLCSAHLNVRYTLKGYPRAKITLSDTGKGIPPDTLSSLFTPFFTTKPIREGNGLGLYLVKKLVEENHGVISLESFPNEGTAVTLLLPVASSSR